MLEEVNARLKAGRVGVRVEQRGDRLYLVATLPAKPGTNRTRPHQQRIALGVKANPAGIKRAELEAKKLGLRLAEGKFTWEPKREKLLTGEAVEIFKAQYFSEKGRSPKTETTWVGNYENWFKRLPDAVLTTEALTEGILTTEANSRGRQLACQAYKLLADRFDVDLDVSRLKGNYGQRSVNPRDLPTDKEIVEAVNRFTYAPYYWVYGVMATYALRNHEVFLVDLEYLQETGICYVGERLNSEGKILTSKSHGGKVWPLYPDWVELFDLKNVRMPRINGKDNRANGQRVSRAFARSNIPFHPYDLRHCWARRAIELGLDSRLAAQQMRHSHQIHTNTYNAWLTDADHSKAWERIRDANVSPGE
jgi:integrase